MIRVLVAMTVAGASAAVGQILLKHGMAQVGSLDHYDPATVLRFFGAAIRNWSVILGTVFNTGFYVLFLASLSWADVSVVLPMSVLEFFFVAVLAAIVLGEHITALRAVGIMFTIVGVILISKSGASV